MDCNPFQKKFYLKEVGDFFFIEVYYSEKLLLKINGNKFFKSKAILSTSNPLSIEDARSR